MRNQGKQYIKRGAKNAGRGCIPGRGYIEERPKATEGKSHLGDRELDLVIGTQSPSRVLLTLGDRVSMVTIIRKLKDKTAKGAAKSRILALKGWPVHTILSDIASPIL